ncbi:peptidoglycan recognition protein family protein [Lactococcus lactis]|uniref:peptidoglycan recognition protein family protein n=1 Tax=Lactococcus lactis TaxID=1358 RepID=UPI001D18429B|nr:N-acetylmuramoyl-L-alanine amidase [Lactococcus lactis]MCC4121898.1 N-acetylmuramoyl-L-alanine amidase [Lactococcus lactis]
MSYTINKEFMLAANEGDSRKAQNWYIIAHETANPRATGRNEASYMKNNWRNAYTTHIVGDGIVYLIGEPGYVSWGALDANCYAPAQIELQHTTDKALFEKNYRVYVELIRDLCNQFGIPKTLDAGRKGTKGVKSHQWVTQNYGGDHTDPYGYLASMGISREQFARDIANGFGSSCKPVTAQSKPVAKPQTPSDHDKAVAASKAVHQGNAWAKLDKFNEVSKGKVRIAGWLVPDKPDGSIGKCAYILIMKHGTNEEITRVASQGIKRPDVKKTYGYKGGDALGMDVTVDLSWVKKGTKINIIFRRCNQANGEGAVNDVRFRDIYLTL